MTHSFADSKAGHKPKLQTEVIRSAEHFQKIRSSLRKTKEDHHNGLSVQSVLREKSVGFVPTMGALHAGHRSLLSRCRKENDISVLSIFVNPTQFNDPKDLEKYPATWSADLQMAQDEGVDYIFYPQYSDIYSDNYRFKVIETEFSRKFCGSHRPGHFDGVLTVVMKLLNIVSPNKAYFGEKDFQQLTLIQDMVKAFFLPYEIIGLPTVRHSDGLAQSSRNLLLSVEARAKASSLHLTISQAGLTDQDVAKKLQDLGFEVDYVETWGTRRLAAARLGGVRLIDNVEL